MKIYWVSCHKFSPNLNYIITCLHGDGVEIVEIPVDIVNLEVTKFIDFIRNLDSFIYLGFVTFPIAPFYLLDLIVFEIKNPVGVFELHPFNRDIISVHHFGYLKEKGVVREEVWRNPDYTNNLDEIAMMFKSLGIKRQIQLIKDFLDILDLEIYEKIIDIIRRKD